MVRIGTITGSAISTLLPLDLSTMGVCTWLLSSG
jgi:hypothetical protein